ncbi:SpoIIE family protein phosphatase [Streptomyces sp. Tue 6430]|nr:SpoIIE family protein phosphatase [Streptomyces sp. Tue 6430]
MRPGTAPTRAPRRALGATADGPPPPPPRESPLGRVGSAEWNLLTDEAVWSPELHGIVGRDPAAPPLTLDELPSLVLEEDRPYLTALVTGCLVDAKPIDGEFRVVRPDGEVRTVHMMGEPVLDARGSTTSMWAVLRDVSELRRSRRAVGSTRDSLHLRDPLPPRRRPAPAGHRPATGPREATPSSRHGSPRLPRTTGTLDVAVRHLPATTSSPLDGGWYDVLELPDGDTLLGTGVLTGHGPDATATPATTLGALRGMAMSGAGPAQLLSWLEQLLSVDDPPPRCSTVYCRYRPATRTLAWAQTGHPARCCSAAEGGSGWTHRTASSRHRPGRGRGQGETALEEGDVLVLHTDGLVPADGPDGPDPLLDLARASPARARHRTAHG